MSVIKISNLYINRPLIIILWVSNLIISKPKFLHTVFGVIVHILKQIQKSHLKKWNFYFLLKVFLSLSPSFSWKQTPKCLLCPHILLQQVLEVHAFNFLPLIFFWTISNLASALQFHQNSLSTRSPTHSSLLKLTVSY